MRCLVGTDTVTAQGHSPRARHARSGDFYLANNGDLHLATSGDFSWPRTEGSRDTAGFATSERRCGEGKLNSCLQRACEEFEEIGFDRLAADHSRTGAPRMCR
jgi:hypothetical protein